jgi:hypothetical protein
MFCRSCGQAIEEGKAFCTNCGAPVSQTAQATPPDKTAVRAPAPASVPGAYGAGWQPPQGPPAAMPKRTGLIAGIVVVAIIILAGAGVGIWLALRGDDTGTTAGSSTETVAGDGSATAQTVPGLEGSEEGGEIGESEGGATTGYSIAAENLVMELDFEDGRIPELADMINESVPDVPGPVHDELVAMRETLSAARTALDGLLVPEELVGAHGWLAQAAEHMANRIQATIDGIEAMWDTGSTSSGTPFFNTGRAERDAYRDAMDEYRASLPGD